MKSFWKKLGLSAAIFLTLLVVLNFDYFWKNLKQLVLPPNPAGQQRSESPPKIEPNLLVIASLDLKAPIQYVDSVSETVFQHALINGVVHYPGTALPGQLGNVYIFGHSSDNPWSAGHYKTVFATLPQIGKGAEIVVSDGTGTAFTYVVTDSFVANKDDVKYLDQQGYQKRLLTVQTSYPIGTSLRRWIVLAQIQPPAAP